MYKRCKNIRAGICRRLYDDVRLRNSFIKYMLIFMLLAGSMLIFTDSVTLQAADKKVTVKTCKLNASGSQITVKAKVKSKPKGKKLYLLNLNANVSESGKKKATPIASAKNKKGTVKFKVKYNESMLYQKFAVAYKTGKKYQIASDVKYITNPEVLATYKGSGPAVHSKKGLQVEELSDSLEIGTKHAVINWTLNSLLNTKATNKTSFTYKNKTYYLDADVIKKNDELVQAYNAAGVRVTVILLLPKDASSAGTKAMQFGGYSYTLYSSIKTSSKEGCQTFEAIMTYLARRYGTQQNLVSGWILGNEVNSACIWNYGGNKSLDAYMTNYARAFRICYNAVKSVSKNANVYISLDNCWNKDADGSGKRYFTSKATVDKFYEKIKAYGKISFQIAYHAYPQGMSDPVFWDDMEASNSTSARIVNFKNIKILTDYAKKKFGKNCKIMLSEQSFNSSRGEEIQAAAYAYAYYICEGNNMIEAFIYGREFDHPDEMNLGYRWGLCNEWHVKRLIWSVFQYIDTKESFTFTDPLVKYTNIKNWKKIKGFKRTMCSKMPSRLQQGVITKIESASTTSLRLTWNKMNAGDGYEIYRDGKLLTTISGNSTVTYLDQKLVNGSTHRYQVRMYKEAPKADNAAKRVKIYGAFSNAVSALVTVGTPVFNEANWEVNGNTIKVVWKKMEDAAGFEVYRSTAANGAYTLVQTITDRTKHSYTDVNLSPGVTYYYKVRAYVTINGTNYYGNFSEPLGRQAFMGLTARIENGKVVLEWTAWEGVTDYRVFCKASAASSAEDFTRIAIYWPEATYSLNEFNGIHFAPGQTYSFCLRAKLPGAEKPTPKYSSNIVQITIDESIYDIESITPQTPEGAETTETTEPEHTEEPGTKEPENTETAEDTAESGSAETAEHAGEPESTEATEHAGEPESTEAAESAEKPGDAGAAENTKVLYDSQTAGITKGR